MQDVLSNWYKCGSVLVCVPNVVSAWIRPAAKAHGTVTMKELLKECTAGEPHPAARVHAPICIQQQLLKHLRERKK